MDQFPSRLKELRLKRGLSQRALANLIGVEPIVISRYERGVCKPRMERAQAIARAIETTLDHLLGDEVPDVSVDAPSAA